MLSQGHSREGGAGDWASRMGAMEVGEVSGGDTGYLRAIA